MRGRGPRAAPAPCFTRRQHMYDASFPTRCSGFPSVAPLGGTAMLQRKARMLGGLGRRRGVGALALISAVAMLGMAATAQAGTLSKSGNELRYIVDNASTANNAVLLLRCSTAEDPSDCPDPDSASEFYLLIDFGETMTEAGGAAASGCEQVNANFFRCRIGPGIAD